MGCTQGSVSHTDKETVKKRNKVVAKQESFLAISESDLDDGDRQAEFSKPEKQYSSKESNSQNSNFSSIPSSRLPQTTDKCIQTDFDFLMKGLLKELIDSKNLLSLASNASCTKNSSPSNFPKPQNFKAQGTKTNTSITGNQKLTQSIITEKLDNENFHHSRTWNKRGTTKTDLVPRIQSERNLDIVRVGAKSGYAGGQINDNGCLNRGYKRIRSKSNHNSPEPYPKSQMKLASNLMRTESERSRLKQRTLRKEYSKVEDKKSRRKKFSAEGTALIERRSGIEKTLRKKRSKAEILKFMKKKSSVEEMISSLNESETPVFGLTFDFDDPEFVKQVGELEDEGNMDNNRKVRSHFLNRTLAAPKLIVSKIPELAESENLSSDSSDIQVMDMDVELSLHNKTISNFK